MMTTMLRFLRHTDLMKPKLKAYQGHREARLAFQRALRDQMAAFDKREAIGGARLCSISQPARSRCLLLAQG
jgi:hypothetical protein